MPQPPFAKMNGIGNSILVLDLRADTHQIDGAGARVLASRPGLGFDQLMAILPARTPGTDAFIDIFNNDGSRAGACGNGTRCVAWAMLEGQARQDLVLETASGLLPTRRLAPDRFAVDMGPPRLGWQDIPLRDPVADTAAVDLPNPPSPMLRQFSAVSMGNPHAVFRVQAAEAVDLAVVGAAIERNPLFPDRVNVSFAEVRARDLVRLRVWERGAGATLACGSAACATVVAMARAGVTDRTARVSLPGGDLVIEWRDDNHVVMTGGVTLEHRGRLPAGLLEAA